MLLMLFGTWVFGDCVHVCLPKIKERENEYPHQVDEMPVQPGDLHRLIAPLTVIESAPNPQSYDSQVDDLARIRPGHGGGYSYIHVRSEETGEDESIAEQEDPHHRLAPGHREGLFIGRPVGDDSRQARERRRGFS